MSFTYGDVDQSPDPEGAMAWQERIDGWPAIKAYKKASFDLLPPYGTILDVGCGTGIDALEMGVERVVCVDRSALMCRRTAQRSSRVVQAEAVALAFPDRSFAACRADRVVQHVPEPQRALDEMVRVTRRGGRVVVADPDQESLVISVPGVSAALVDRVKATRRDLAYRNGRLASQLPALLEERGLVDVSSAAFPLLLTDPDDAFGLPSWPRVWQERGVCRFSEPEIGEWALGMERARRSGLVYAVVYFVVAGTRP